MDVAIVCTQHKKQELAKKTHVQLPLKGKKTTLVCEKIIAINEFIFIMTITDHYNGRRKVIRFLAIVLFLRCCHHVRNAFKCEWKWRRSVSMCANRMAALLCKQWVSSQLHFRTVGGFYRHSFFWNFKRYWTLNHQRRDNELRYNRKNDKTIPILKCG